MSRTNLNDLLSSMLDDSEALQDAAEAREMEERAAERSARPAPEPDAPAVLLDDVVQLTGLIELDLRVLLSTAAPDDLLVVLATSGDGLQRRILRNMSEDSVRWLRQNLEHIDHVTDHERDQARGKVLKVANKLLADGQIRAPEPEAIGRDEAPDGERLELRRLLVDLVQIAQQSGVEALSELARTAGEPLLREGVSKVISGVEGDALREQLGQRRGELERRYAQRLKWMVEALVAIADGETADSFAARVFDRSE